MADIVIWIDSVRVCMYVLTVSNNIKREREREREVCTSHSIIEEWKRDITSLVLQSETVSVDWIA